jgi:outer membrane protein assembly factor BamB
MNNSDLVFIGIRGSVIAMDGQSGARVWETALQGAGFVTLLVDQGRVFAGTHGELFCLDAPTGKILGHDPLKGYGFGLMSIATKNGNSGVGPMAAEDDHRRQDDASGAAVAASG